nr:DUF3265 domain-containing protein [Vibrio sp. S234-5]
MEIRNAWHLWITLIIVVKVVCGSFLVALSALSRC